ncbi:MAG TPA: T9SS type A sorting domain-containing protein [Bacteroidales bacterium]|nr:T9SS type A sorting domain-containing protein [Bacteroidales bacterium]
MKKFFTIICMLISLSLSASHVHLSLTGVASGIPFYYCNTVDTVFVSKPAGGGITDWNNGGGYITADSIPITHASQGYWTCQFGPTSITEFYVNFVSLSPTTPWTIPDTTKCTGSALILKGQVTNQPDFTYMWSPGGATSPTINAVTPGIYSVTVTGACATVTDQIEVLNYPVPVPYLGPDVIACNGNTVVLDPGVFAGYSWSTSVSTPTIAVTTPGTYRVTVTDVNGCHGRDTVEVSFLYPPDINICFVEFDTIVFKNRINWATPPAEAATVNIYSEISTNVYSLIGTVPSTETNYIDMTSNPQNQSNSYKISITDTCGNEGDKSDYHKTITLLSAYDQLTNTYGFTWSAYEGLTVANYLIFGIMNSGLVTQIGSVPGNTFFYNYTNPSPLFVKYFVGFYTPVCNSKTNYMVRSNYVNSLITGINETKDPMFNIFPNPANDNIVIQTDLVPEKIEITDLAGRLIYTTTSKNIDCSGLAKGLYFIRIISEKGEYKTKFAVSR